MPQKSTFKNSTRYKINTIKKTYGGSSSKRNALSRGSSSKRSHHMKQKSNYQTLKKNITNLRDLGFHKSQIKALLDDKANKDLLSTDINKAAEWIYENAPIRSNLSQKRDENRKRLNLTRSQYKRLTKLFPETKFDTFDVIALEELLESSGKQKPERSEGSKHRAFSKKKRVEAEEKDELQLHLNKINHSQINNIHTSLKGLVNLGNTCFVNAALQSLFHMKSFCNFLIKLSKKDNNGIIYKIDSINDHLIQLYSAYNKHGHQFDIADLYSKLFNFIYKVRNDLKMNENKRQEDPSEFIFALSSSFQNNVFYDTFQETIYYDSVVRGLDKTSRREIFKRTTKESNILINFPAPTNKLQETNNLQDLFNNKLEGEHETIEYVEKGENIKKNINQYTIIENLPENLIFKIIRERSHGHQMNTERIEIPTLLSYREKDINYTIRSVICRRGKGRDGHYVCYVYLDNKWYLCNDDAEIVEGNHIGIVNGTSMDINEIYTHGVMLFYTEDKPTSIPYEEEEEKEDSEENIRKSDTSGYDSADDENTSGYYSADDDQQTKKERFKKIKEAQRRFYVAEQALLKSSSESRNTDRGKTRFAIKIQTNRRGKNIRNKLIQQKRTSSSLRRSSKFHKVNKEIPNTITRSQIKKIKEILPELNLSSSTISDLIQQIYHHNIKRSYSSARISSAKKKLFKHSTTNKNRYAHRSVLKNLKKIFPDMNFTQIKEVEERLLTSPFIIRDRHSNKDSRKIKFLKKYIDDHLQGSRKNPIQWNKDNIRHLEYYIKEGYTKEEIVDNFYDKT